MIQKSNAVLFVDDEKNVLRSISRLFHDDEFKIVTITDTEEALERVAKRDFDVVVSDYRMPKMNGIEFLKKVKAISPDTLRIILTGFADSEIIIKAINEGNIYKFHTKPWDDIYFKMDIIKAVEVSQIMKEKQILLADLCEKNIQLEKMNKNLEEMVEERTQQLLDTEKMAVLGQLAAQIGHEINNSLSVFTGNFTLMNHYRDDIEKYEKYSGKCIQAFNRLKMYAGNLLRLGKPEKSHFERKPLHDLVENTLSKLNEINLLKYYSIEKDFMSDVPIDIYCDEVQIDQMLFNVLINAQHAMGNSGTLTININADQNSGTAMIKISDTGTGISPENLDKIFNPFFTTKPKGIGNGLGMSVIKRIMENHHGEVFIESTLGIGTTVFLRFPLVNGTQEIKAGEVYNEKA